MMKDITENIYQVFGTEIFHKDSSDGGEVRQDKQYQAHVIVFIISLEEIEASLLHLSQECTGNTVKSSHIILGEGIWSYVPTWKTQCDREY